MTTETLDLFRNGDKAQAEALSLRFAKAVDDFAQTSPDIRAATVLLAAFAFTKSVIEPMAQTSEAQRRILSCFIDFME